MPQSASLADIATIEPPATPAPSSTNVAHIDDIATIEPRSPAPGARTAASPNIARLDDIATIESAAPTLPTDPLTMSRTVDQATAGIPGQLPTAPITIARTPADAMAPLTPTRAQLSLSPAPPRPEDPITPGMREFRSGVGESMGGVVDFLSQGFRNSRDVKVDAAGHFIDERTPDPLATQLTTGVAGVREAAQRALSARSPADAVRAMWDTVERAAAVPLDALGVPVTPLRQALEAKQYARAAGLVTGLLGALGGLEATHARPSTSGAEPRPLDTIETPQTAHVDDVVAIEPPPSTAAIVPPAPDLVPPGAEAAYNTERRVSTVGAPDETGERRQLPTEQVLADFRDPEMVRQFEALRARVAAAGPTMEAPTHEAPEAPASADTTAGPEERAGLPSGGAEPGGRDREGARAAAAEAPPDYRQRARARRDEDRASRIASDDALVQHALDRAVAEGYAGDTAPLRLEIADRVQLVRELDRAVNDSDRNPRRVLQEVARLGGISLKAEEGGAHARAMGLTGLAGELRWLKEFRETNFGQVAGVPGVFSDRRGLPLDELVTRLREHGEFQHIESPSDLVEEIAAAARGGKPDADDNAIGRALDSLGPRWWDTIGRAPDALEQIDLSPYGPPALETPEGWRLEVDRPRTKEGHTAEAEVDWRNKRIVFSSQQHLDNVEIRNHEIAHVLIETLPTHERDALFNAYIAAKEHTPAWQEYGRDWIVQNHFHREEIAMDAGTHFTTPDRVSPTLKALFDKYLGPVARRVQEPGELGGINPMLAARLGLGAAGAVYGASTGTDTADRLKRAALFGVGGLAVPSVLSAGARVATAMREGTARGAAEDATTTDAAAGAEVEGARRLFTPKAGAMPERPITPARPMPTDQKFGVTWLRKYAPKVREPIAKTFADYDGFEAQRRGVQPDARVEELAHRIAVDMAPTRPGSIANVEESRAIANATATLFDRMKAVRAQLAEVATGEPRDALTTQLGKLYADGAVLLGNVRANASEQGRALRGQQIINAALSSYDERILAEASKRLGPHLRLFADQLARLPDDPRAFYALLREHVNAGRGPSDQFFAYLYNNVLSGPSTFLKNVMGTGTNTIFQAGANVLAGALEARKPLAERTVLLGEPGAALSAMTSGLFRGGKAALFLLRHGFDPLAIDRGEIPPVFTELPGGAATNWPTRLTRAVHGVLFQEGARSFEATSLAYTQAAQEAARQSLSGPALTKFLARRTAQLAETPALQQQARDYAARATFTEDPGPTGRAFGNLLHSNKALRFLQLFWKIPWNIAKQQLRDNTLLAFVPQLGESGVYAGGRVGAQAQARAILGTAALAPLVAAIGAGRVTGEGPTDPKQRPLWLATHKPNSIQIGPRWIDYRALPIATPLSMLANLHEALQEGIASDAETSRVLSMVASRVGNVVTSQPFLAGITSFINAMERPAEQGSALLKSSAQMLVPYSGALRNVTRAVDPTYREVHTPLEAAQEVIPGASSTLTPRLDLFGQPLQRSGGPLARALAPSVPVEGSTDPLVTYLESIRAPIGADARQSVLRLAPGLSVKVPAAADLARRQQAGQSVRPILEQLVTNPRFQALADDDKRYLVSQLVATVRSGVRRRSDAALTAQAAANPSLLRREAR